MSDELNELKAEIARLQARVDAYEAEPTPAPVARRNMLRALGAAGAGAAVGGLALAKPAGAVNGDPLLVGQTEDANNSTILHATGNSGPLVGAFHVTNDLSQEDLSLTASCISAIATGSGGGAQDIAFAGSGSRIGAKLDGPVPLKLVDSSNSGAPTSSSGTQGQFKVDNGDLWYCARTAGTGVDAIWRLLATADDPPAPTTPLQFFPLTPYRGYDSRFADGKLTADGDRTVSLKDALEVATGAVTTADAIPVSAQAVTCNLTAVATTGPGFLAITPASATSAAASSINYGGPTAAIANGTVTALSGNREVKVFIGGTPGHQADFIVDVTGYWA